MPTFISDLLTQVKSIWARLDGGQRLTIGAVLLATAVGMGAIVWYAGQPDYVNLVTAKNQGEYMEVIKTLQSQQIRFKNNGRAVLVSSDDLQTAQIALDDAGVLGGNETESIISQLSSTSAAMKMRLFNKQLRIVEAKLGKSRMIQEATITAHQPRRSLYAADDEVRKATVIIKLAKGADFYAAAQLALDATSSDLGLAPEKVTVYDDTASMVYTHRENGGGATDGVGFLRLREKWRLKLNSLANRAVMQVFQDKVDVTVNIALKPIAEHKTGVNLPEEGLTPNMVETSTETSETGQETPRGDPNNPNEAEDVRSRGSVAGRKKSNTKKETRQIDKALYGVKTVAQLAPLVEKITVAVVISDEIMAGITDESEREKKRLDIEAIVKQAVGFDQERGDEIESRVFKFEPSIVVAEEPGPDVMAIAQSFAPAVGQVLAVILVILFLRGMLKKVQVKKPAVVEDLPLEEAPEDLAPEEVAKRMRREIEKAINEDPAAISRMLDNWLTEQKA